MQTLFGLVTQSCTHETNVPLVSAEVRGGGRLRDELKECLRRRLVEVQPRTFSVEGYFRYATCKVYSFDLS